MKRQTLLFLSIIGMVCLFSCEKAPFLTLSTPNTISFTDQGGMQSISFTANRSWSVSSSDSWCKVSPSSGDKSDGNISVTITCEPNATYDPRVATLTIKVDELMETITVTQDTNYGLLVSPTTYNLSNAAQTIEVEVRANVKYSVEIDAACKDWITQTGTKALSTDKITFAIAANESYDNREGKITIRQMDGTLSQILIVKQKQTDYLSIGTNQFSLSNEEHLLSIEIESNFEYEVSTAEDWIQQVNTKGITASTVVIEVEANKKYNVRTGLVYIKQKEGDFEEVITIVQEAEPVIDIYETGRANCYVVNNPGWYCIDAKFKGNSITEPIGPFNAAEVLWESFNTVEKPNIGDLIEDIDVREEKVYFRVTDNFRPGNALICVKNDGLILWSWHIWITDVDINTMAKQYYNGAIVMDRNLGALSSEPGDVLSLGLLYQWGRKDPFLGSCYINSGESGVVAEATNVHKDPVMSDQNKGTIEYSIQHPMTPIQYRGNDSYDWLYSSTGASDNTRWSDEKTIYDPCPAGWQIPNESFWKGLFQEVSYRYSFFDNSLMDIQNRGVYLNKYSGIQSWYPFAGQIDPNATQFLYSVGRSGYWWTNTSNQSRAGCLYFYYDADGLRIYPILYTYKSHALSVRCVKTNTY